MSALQDRPRVPLRRFFTVGRLNLRLRAHDSAPPRPPTSHPTGRCRHPRTVRCCVAPAAPPFIYLPRGCVDRRQPHAHRRRARGHVAKAGAAAQCRDLRLHMRAMKRACAGQGHRLERANAEPLRRRLLLKRNTWRERRPIVQSKLGAESGSERTRAVSNGSLAESSARTEKRRVRTSASSVVVRSTRKGERVHFTLFRAVNLRQ